MAGEPETFEPGVLRTKACGLVREFRPVEWMRPACVMSGVARPSGVRFMFRLRFTAFLLFVVVASSTSAPADVIEAGPFAHAFPLTLESGRRTEIIGPLGSWFSGESGDGWAASPFVAEVNEPGLEHRRIEILYPFFTFDRFGTESRGQIFQIFNWGDATTVDDEKKRGGAIWPLVFWKHSTEPTNSYFAFIPFYGHVKGHLFRDEVRVTMAPLYVWSRKGQMETRNYLFPFIHFRHGGGIDGWQFIPFAGHETKSPSYVTNVADDLELVPGYDKWFFWWPMIGCEDNNLGSTNVEHLRFTLPFYSILRSPARDNTTLLWPFFTKTEDRERGFVEWGAPYPFVGWARGPGKTANRLWPVWGNARGHDLESDFAAWPAYTHRRLLNDGIDRERTSSFFYLYDDLRLANPQTGDQRHRITSFPFFFWRKDFDGSERLQALALLDAIFPENKGIQRSWSPLWALYREERNPKTKHRSQSLLWNLWRRDVTPEERRASFLFGVVRTRCDASGRHWRYFWTPFKPSENPGTSPASEHGKDAPGHH
jgi:hypothetical protein